MVDPDRVARALNDHFAQLSLGDFEARRKRTGGEAEPTKPDRETNVILFQREAAPLPLNAYLATALTGLDESQRIHVFSVCDVITGVCEDLDIAVYEPRKHTDPVEQPSISPEQVFRTDRERVLGSDLVIHVADYASTGAGEELDFALAALIPIVIVSHGESRVSRMVLGIPALKLEVRYGDLDELKAELRERLVEIRPILEERKLAFSSYDQNIVGTKIRATREEQQLTRDEVAGHTSHVMTSERLAHIEESSDRIGNPSLLELRTAAAILKTTVADLVEPDLNERVLVVIQEWLEGRSAARSGISDQDMRKIIRRILYRMLDSLER